MQTKDGYLMVGAAGEAIWARCAKALGHPEWCEDSRFATNQARVTNRDALEDVMNAVLTTKTTNDWVEVLEAAGVPCGPVYDYAQMFATRRCATAGSCNMQATRNWASCRTSARPSGSAKVCGCATSRPSSASTTPRSLAASGSAKRK
jgi:crotonobetainyl-CoA:carnitine CoA-transferase CaiB-like acyl-CoA transferase